MVKEIINLIDYVKSEVTNDLKNAENENAPVVKMVLDAYNYYQEGYRDGVDYIFDIDNPNDLKDCIGGGLTAEDISNLYIGYQHGQYTKYFCFGCNYEVPTPVGSFEILRKNLISWLNMVISNVIRFPFECDAYTALYTRYVSDAIYD